MDAALFITLMIAVWLSLFGFTQNLPQGRSGLTKCNAMDTVVNLTPKDSLVDEVWGVKGTPRRDEMEARLKEEVESSMSEEPASIANGSFRRSRAARKLELA